MKKHIIYSSVLLASVFIGTGCSENAWNDHLDGFEGGFSNTDKITVSYTLSNTDYETIGKALAKVATTDEEAEAAKAIQANHYFDQSSVYPAQIAIPYLFDDTSTDFFIYNNGSIVETSFRQAEATPEEISKISSAYTYTITSATESNELPGLLKQKYPDASEGEYAIVSYLEAGTSKLNVSPVAQQQVAKSSSPVISTRSEAVWTVKQALANMESGYEGEAIVIGIISSITDLSTSYGNATYFIKDNLDDEESLEIFRGYYIDGEKFTADDQLAVGATVVVSGKLVIYNGTYEFTTGSQIMDYYAESIWAVKEALSQMEDGFTGEAIVKGVISEITDLSTSYGNATYFIKDNPDDEESLEIFRGYYIDGEKFTSEDQLKVGDIVIVSGNLVVYNGTYEFNSGSKILSYYSGNSNSGYGNLTDNIRDLAVGDVLSATAVVSAQCTRGLILTDNAGSILYYNTSVDLSTYPIGTVVEVSGEVSAYNKGFQLSNSSSIEVIESMNYDYPAPVEYTGEMVTAATEGTENMLAQYSTIEGVVTFSGNYTNIVIPGTSIQGSAYYITDELKGQLVSGGNYKFYGYFTSFTSSYFYMVITGFDELTPAVDPNSLTNEIFYYDGSNWNVAENANVLNPTVYKQMGFNNNELSDPEIYIPLYLKTAYPYALAGDQVFVAYNIMTNAASCDLFVFDGSSWSLNDNGLETVTAAFTKTDGKWFFTKYLGKAVFTLFEENSIITDRTYMFVSGDACANPVLASNSYGYLLSTTISISGNAITMKNDINGFQFLSSFEVDGKVVNAPEGYFIIRDSNERFLYCQGTYSSFNVSDSPAVSSGTFTDNYLFSASKNDNGSWTISSKFNGRILYYSTKYSNFAVYAEQSADDSLPFLYILEE